MRDTIRDKIFLALKYVVGFGLLAYIFSKVDASRTWETLLGFGPLVLLPVIAVGLIHLALQFGLWRFLTQHHSAHVEARDLLPSFFAGFAFRMMLPGGNAEIAKVFLLRGRKRGKVIAFAAEKFFQTTLKILLVAFTLPVVFPEYRYGLWALGAATVVAYLVLPFLLKRDIFHRFQEKNVDYIRIFTISVLYNMPIFLTMVLQYHILLNAHYDISWMHTLWVGVFVWSAGLIPVSVSGLGVRENLAVFFLAQYGVSGGAAVGVSLLVFFLNAIIPALIGGIIIMRRRQDLKNAGSELKQMTQRIYKNGKSKEASEQNRRQEENEQGNA